jgi:argininosuccinate lyase
MTSDAMPPGTAPRHAFEARLSALPSPQLAAIMSRRVDSMLQHFPAQLRMDMAHTVMLAEQEVLSPEEAAAILRVLSDVERDGVDALNVDRTKSSLFWNIEAALITALGERVGGKMHTGRSHNDIVPTVSRLTARGRLVEVLGELLGLRAALLERAAKHVTTIMPGYTSLQHGQPWTFGHYLSGWDFAFARDAARVRAALERTNVSPLGASALAGSSWPLDRERTAVLLGFDGYLLNSRDAGFGTADYVVEILAAIGILMNNVNTLASDLYLWSSFEYGMVELADAYCGSSSQMPQKKNPWAVDWVRGMAGNATSYYASALGALRGSSSSDGSMQIYPEASLPVACTDATLALSLLAGVIETLTVHEETMFNRASANWTTANNLADAIVVKAGVSYRSAHGVVGKLVRTFAESDRSPADATGAAVDQAAEAMNAGPVGLSDEEVRQALDPVGFIESRVTSGSVHPDEVRRMLDGQKVSLEADREWLEGVQDRISTAEDALRSAVAARIDAA